MCSRFVLSSLIAPSLAKCAGNAVVRIEATTALVHRQLCSTQSEVIQTTMKSRAVGRNQLTSLTGRCRRSAMSIRHCQWPRNRSITSWSRRRQGLLGGVRFPWSVTAPVSEKDCPSLSAGCGGNPAALPYRQHR